MSRSAGGGGRLCGEGLLLPAALFEDRRVIWNVAFGFSRAPIHGDGRTGPPPHHSEASLPHTPLVLSVEEAARLLGISRTLAYDLARRGGLPSIRLGRRIVIPVAALIAFLDVDHLPPTA